MKRLSILAAACLWIVSLCAGCGSEPDPIASRAAEAPGSPGSQRSEYIFPHREMELEHAAPPFRLVERVRIPELHSLRGVAVDPRSGTVYASVGGNGGSSGHGGLVAYHPRDHTAP